MGLPNRALFLYMYVRHAICVSKLASSRKQRARRGTGYLFIGSICIFSILVLIS